MMRRPCITRALAWGPAWLFAAIMAATVAASGQVAPSSRDLLDRIWKRVAEVQRRETTACGTIVETRTSPLFTRPQVARGTFCVAGTDRFRLDYTQPTPVRILYNRGILNLSADGGAHTEAMDIADAVSRTQKYFSGPESAATLERDFKIEVSETPDRFVMRLTSVAGPIAKRASRIGVELGKADAFPRQISIEGRNRVTSVFDITVDRTDITLKASIFEVYDPRPPGRRPKD